MDRLTTDNRETNLQTLLNYAYAKDRAVHLAYGNGEDNIPLDEYIAHEASAHGCPKTTTEVMEGGCMECDCPIAILNAVAIQAAELRARLMMIEDILGDTYNLDHLRELIEADKDTNVPSKTATDKNVGGKKSLLYSHRLLLAKMSDPRSREAGVSECALSVITYLYKQDLIDVEKALAFLESAAKEKEDANHDQD